MRTFPFKVPEVKLATTSGEEAGEVGGGGGGVMGPPQSQKEETRQEKGDWRSLFGVPEVTHFAYVCPPICS